MLELSAFLRPQHIAHLLLIPKTAAAEKYLQIFVRIVFSSRLLSVEMQISK